MKKKISETFTPEFVQVVKIPINIKRKDDWIPVKFNSLSTEDLELLKKGIEKELESRK